MNLSQMLASCPTARPTSLCAGGQGQSRDRRFYGAGVGGGMSGADSGLAFPVIEVMGTGTRRFSSVRDRRGVLWSC